jgi:hypothetical protein
MTFFWLTFWCLKINALEALGIIRFRWIEKDVARVGTTRLWMRITPKDIRVLTVFAVDS